MNRKITHLLFLNVILIAAQGNVSVSDHPKTDDIFSSVKEIKKVLKNYELYNQRMEKILNEIEHENDALLNKKQYYHKTKNKSEENDCEELELILKDDYLNEVHEVPACTSHSSSDQSDFTASENSSNIVTEKLESLLRNSNNGDNVVSEDSYFHKVIVLKIPLSYETVLAFIVIIIFTLLGVIYLYKICSTQYCRCKL